MSLPDRFSDIVAIRQLNEDFCFELDRGTPEGFANLFTENAIYTHGLRKSCGRREILLFARSRRSSAPRTSRHVLSGLRIELLSKDRAKGISSCTTFAASAEPPIASTVPVLVADFQDIYVLLEGQWFIAERHIVPIFTPAPL